MRYAYPVIIEEAAGGVIVTCSDALETVIRTAQPGPRRWNG
jgi:hypothetical protein